MIPTLITQALALESVELGSTHPTRDFLYVEDLARGFMRCAEADGVEGEVINLGTGTEISIAELAKTVFRLVGRESALTYSKERARPEKSEVERLLADVSKAKRLLDWEAEVSLEEGLQRTIEWFEGSLDAYKPSIYNV